MFFFSSENWLTIQTAGLHNKSDNRKYDKTPVSDWVEGDQKDLGLQTSMIRCRRTYVDMYVNGDTQRG